MKKERTCNERFQAKTLNEVKWPWVEKNRFDWDYIHSII